MPSSSRSTEHASPSVAGAEYRMNPILWVPMPRGIRRWQQQLDAAGAGTGTTGAASRLPAALAVALDLNGAADELDNVVDNAVDNVGNSIARIRIAASLQQPGRNDAREGHYNRPQNDNQKHLKKKKKKKKKRRETAEK